MAVQAFAKLVAPGWQYYMTKPKITLGRGGDDMNCDVAVSNDFAVSRHHFTIRFAPELNAFEVETMSKNGILINGDFQRRLAKPYIIRSHADIVFGPLNDHCLSFIVPNSMKASKKKRERATDQTVPLIQWIGELLMNEVSLSAEQIQKSVENMHPDALYQLGPEDALASSIRSVLTQNDHIFCVVDSDKEEGTQFHANEQLSKCTDGPLFTVRSEYHLRFAAFLSEAEEKNHRNRKCVDPFCKVLRSSRESIRELKRRRQSK